jgi:hypothetical protein
VGARALIAAALAALVVVAACSGPHATATDARLRPSSRSGFYRVETRVANTGGSGQIDLIVRLKNREDGRVVTRQQPVDLQPHDRADVAVEIPAPPGDYAVDVSVQYPPR